LSDSTYHSTVKAAIALLPARDCQALFKRRTKMARIALNQVAPGFRLPDFSSKTVSLSDFRDRQNVLLVFNRGFN
jgi:hypothetical protein